MKKFIFVFLFIIGMAVTSFTPTQVQAFATGEQSCQDFNAITYYPQGNDCIKKFRCVPSSLDDGCFCQTPVVDPSLSGGACKTTTGLGAGIGELTAPTFVQNLGFGAAGLGNVITGILTLFYVIAILVLLLMFIWAAFDWITSGGDKERIAKARSTIINAIIGTVIIFVSLLAVNQLILPSLNFAPLFIKSNPPPVCRPGAPGCSG